MKTSITTHSPTVAIARSLYALALTLGVVVSPNAAQADETCSSPYLARIEGQEEFVYVWTLGVEGLGDGSDKLVTVDVKPGSPNYGKVINSSSVEGRNEAHHGGFTDDRRQLWLAGLENSRVFIFDVHTDPAKPQYVKTIDNFAEATGGAIGPARYAEIVDWKTGYPLFFVDFGQAETAGQDTDFKFVWAATGIAQVTNAA